MQAYSHFLRRDPYAIDEMQCRSAASAISEYRTRVEVLPWGGLEGPQQLAFKLAFVAICHKINWDFLQQRLAQVLLPQMSDLFSFLAGLNAQHVEDWLGDYSQPERIRAKERAALLRNLGKKMLSEFDGCAWRLYEQCGRRLGGENGFIALLDAFDAYRSDPLRKKSHVLTHDLVREGIARFVDEDAMEPAIDYHLIRIYLRTARVVSPGDPEALDAILGPRPRQRLVNLLRRKVSDAVKYTAWLGDLSIPEVNYVEWQLGRTTCRKMRPRCRLKNKSRELDQDIATLFEGTCPYLDFCIAFRDKRWMAMREPADESAHY